MVLFSAECDLRRLNRRVCFRGGLSGRRNRMWVVAKGQTSGLRIGMDLLVDSCSNYAGRQLQIECVSAPYYWKEAKSSSILDFTVHRVRNVVEDRGFRNIESPRRGYVHAIDEFVDWYRSERLVCGISRQAQSISARAPCASRTKAPTADFSARIWLRNQKSPGSQHGLVCAQLGFWGLPKGAAGIVFIDYRCMD